MKNYILLSLPCLVLTLLCGLGLLVPNEPRAAEPELTWVDATFEDFSRGTLDAAGQNIYVSRDGKVRTINRFDLNGDGHLDLIFNCTHNTYQMISATAGRMTKERKTESLDVAVEGSQRLALADLNRDGYTDVVFCPNAIGVNHPRRFVTIAWGGPDGWPAHRCNGALPINSAQAIAIVDLNHDGWPDIAVLGAERWQIDQPPGRIIRIFWGSKDGFLPKHHHDIGIAGARDIASADFDQDGAGDLAVLRNDGKVIIVWAASATTPAKGEGKQNALEFARSEIDLPGPHATSLFAADTNGDKRPDLVAGTSQNAVYLVGALPERKWSKAQEIPASAASHVAVGDLDGDGHPDLVLTQFSSAHAAGGEQAGAGKDAANRVRILWGSARGFDKNASADLKVNYAVATAIGDMDGDGQPDLIVAVHQSKDAFNGESLVFFGTGNRKFKLGDLGFRTSGTTDVAFASAEKDLPARAVFCNSIGGKLDEHVPVHVYLGGKEGFDVNRMWKIPFHSGYEASAADLNADGYVDLILLNSGHGGPTDDPTLGANIFWGGPKGFDFGPLPPTPLPQGTAGSRSVIREHFLGTSSVADLDRDGYLDLVLEPFSPAKPGAPDEFYVYYGSAKGFDRSRRVALPKEGYTQEHVLADCNGDGWLDIVTTSIALNCVRIYWGGPQGFAAGRETRIPVANPIGLRAADFNADGYLDLIVSSYHDETSRHRDMGSVILWGSARGYHPSNSQWLPGFSPLGRTVADFDGDGYLDIFSPQHSGEFTREDLACHIYWGSAQGFATRRRTTLFCDSVCDAVAGDFNGDGRLDLAVACHTRHGDHRIFSRVFYNDGQRFENPKVQKLPTNGTHLMWALDMGHIYDRKFRQRFDSRIFEWKEGAKGGKLAFKSSLPEGTRLTGMVRSAATKDALGKQTWRPVAEGAFTLAAEDRCMQYQAVFHSDNGDRYPVLERVEIGLRH